MINPMLLNGLFSTSIMADTDLLGTINGIDMSGTIVRLIAFLLGVCGATYLAAGLWSRSEKGSQSWKYLSISMVLFVFWNIIGAFSILLDVLNYQNSRDEITISPEAMNLYLFIVKILDPILEVIVFILLLFGLRKIIYTMRTKPWTVFSNEDDEKEEIK